MQSSFSNSCRGRRRVPEERRTEPGEISREFWLKTVREAFKNDPLRIIIELVKNSADSYTRLEKQGKANIPYEIFVRIHSRKNEPPTIEVCDHAEGMDSGKLREALKYGTQVSMGEDLEAVTSAEKGIGLKDALMALRDNWLIAIKDGLLNERNKHVDFSTGIGREDENVSDEQRKDLRIPNNGTLIRGKLPDYFHDRKYETIREHLQKHFLLRKLLQCPEYKVYVIEGDSRREKPLVYQPPKVERQMLYEELKIRHGENHYFISITINKSTEALDQGKPYGESGLLFFYGKYSVADFTLGRFERDQSFSRIFGEVKMEIERLVRDPEEAPLIDEKRRGLDTTHPFNIQLMMAVNQRLVSIQEQVESKYAFADESKRNVLKEVNKIYKEIKGKATKPEPPIKPELFEFYPPYASIVEYEPRRVFLIINPSVIAKETMISLKSDNPKISVKPNTIAFDDYEIPKDFVIKNMELYSEHFGIKGEIIAESSTLNHSSKIGVEVLANPIFSPENGFSFVPSKTTIVDGGAKKVDLCVDKTSIDSSKEIDLLSQDPVGCPGKWMLPDPKNVETKMIKNILKLEIPISIKGKGHIGEKAAVVAMYGDRTSNLRITVIPEPTLGGFLRDILFSDKETKRISSFIEDEGILEIYRKHPLIKKYMQGKFTNKPDFLVFVSDVITREVLRSIVLCGIKEGLSRYSIFDLGNPEPEIDDHIAREYYEYGPRMHEAFIKLVHTLR
jgi:hypothetical protein